MHRKFQSKGVVFLGMTSQPAKYVPDMRAFLKNNGVRWPNVFGADKTMTGFQVGRLPAVWVIGRDGKVVWNLGEESKIEDAIEHALKEVR